MRFTRNILEKRGTWRRLATPAGSFPSAIHADRRNLIWLSQPGDTPDSARLECFDGLHTRNILPDLHIDAALRRVGFSADDHWWGITGDSKLLAVDLNTRHVTDFTPLVPDLSRAFWLWTTPKSSDIIMGLPGKLVRFDKHNAIIVDLEYGEDPQAHGATISPGGELWFTSDTGLYRFDGHETRQISATPEINAPILWELLVSTRNVAWVSIRDGVLRFEGGDFTVVPLAPRSADYTPLLEDTDGNVWLRTTEIAISCVTPDGTITHFTTEDGLTSPRVLCVTQDPQNRLWFACRGAGLSLYDPENLLTLTPHCVNASINWDKGAILGTPMNGLLYWHDDTVTVLNRNVSCGSSSAICRRSSTQLLIFSVRWLNTLDMTADDADTALSASPVQWVHYATCDHQGAVWITTGHYIIRCTESDTWQATYEELGIIREELGIIRSQTVALLAFSLGILILTTPRNGILYYLSGKETKRLGCLLPAVDSPIVCGYEDSRKRLWLASAAGPIFFCEGTSCREIRIDGHAINVETSSIIEDSRGAIWFGTAKGILKYDGQVHQRLTTAYGLPEDHVKGLSLMDNGDIIIATIRGAFRYRPNYEMKPLVRATRVVTDTPHDPASIARMHAGMPAVTFHYEGASTKLGRLKYQYRLEGHELEWHETWDEHVRYEGLPPGNYAFHVRAVDFDLAYSDEAPPALLQVEEDPVKRTIMDLQQRLQQKDKMESLGSLASGVAHDFNNLMGVVIGNADLAHAAVPPNSEIAECLADIEKAARHAARLCTEVLNLAGKSAVGHVEVNLDKRLAELVHLLRPSISRKIAINCSLPPTLPSILADETRINQIILNLLTNAGQAIGDAPGTISASARVAPLDAQDLRSPYIEETPKPGLYVVLEIEDTGCGMRPEVLERLFDPFFTTKPTGRGLGLAAVKGIIQAHHGTLQVRSTPGVGTKFTICLPAYRDRTPAAG